MAILQDYEVQIALRPALEEGPGFQCEGDPLREYPDPKPTDRFKDVAVERYIEAIPDREFQIQIHLEPSFDLFEADVLRVTVTIDWDTVRFCRYYSKSQIVENTSEEMPFIIQSACTTDGTDHFRNSFSFGSLESGK